MANTAYLLLGSNEGDRMQWMNSALELITEECGDIIQRSSVYETEAWGIEDQPAFLNMAICINTRQPPLKLLKNINGIEHRLGRQRAVKWGQRTLDIDILFYNNEIVNLPELIIPHPELEKRRFALAPLYEIAPDLVHPISHKTIEQLLESTPDTLAAKKISS